MQSQLLNILTNLRDRVSQWPKSFILAAIYIFFSAFSGYQTGGFSLSNSILLILLSIYARNLELATNHPKKLFIYYIIYEQWTWTILYNTLVESVVIVGLFFYLQSQLLKHNNEQKPSPDNTPLDQNNINSSPQISVKRWPFILAATLILSIYVLCILDTYNSDASVYIDYGYNGSALTNHRHIIRKCIGHLAYLTILIAIQGYFILPSSLFQRAFTTFKSKLPKFRYFILYFIFIGVFSIITQTAVHNHVELYAFVLCDSVFYSGPSFFITLLFLQHLYQACIQPKQPEDEGAAVTIRMDQDLSTGGEIKAPELEHNELYEGYLDQQSGIDISDLSASLSSPSYLVDVPSIDSVSEYNFKDKK